MATPSSTTSLIKNCPSEEESLGKPPRLGSHPGAENRNAAAALPTADTLGNHERRAIDAAMAISTMPSQLRILEPTECCTSNPSRDYWQQEAEYHGFVGGELHESNPEDNQS